MEQRRRTRRSKRLKKNILENHKTISDAIRAWGVGRATMYRWIKQGRIPYRSQVWLSHRGVNIEKVLKGL